MLGVQGMEHRAGLRHTLVGLGITVGGEGELPKGQLCLCPSCRMLTSRVDGSLEAGFG